MTIKQLRFRLILYRFLGIMVGNPPVPKIERYQIEVTENQALRGEIWNGPKAPKGRFEE